jgi:flavodoxin
MKMRLYVFTGTGNSLWIARRLALELKEATLEFIARFSHCFK